MHSKKLQNFYIQNYLRIKLLILLVLITVLTLFFAPLLGSITYHPLALYNYVVKLIQGKNLDLRGEILINLRLPRIIMCILVGAALSVSGVVMQAVFRNPLAEPFVLGMSSGAALGAILGFIFNFNFYAISALAFLTSLFSVFLVYSIAKVSKYGQAEALLLSGIAVNFLFYALEWLLLIRTNAYMILSWLVGHFGGIRWLEVRISLIPIVLGIIIIFFFSKDLNALMFGDETAHYLGVDPKFTRNVTVTFTTLITAISTAFVGLVGFVGLMVPHMSRLLIGNDNRFLIPFSAFFGAVFLTWADVLTRLLMGDIPVGIVTMLLGAPFFIYLQVYRKI